MKQSLLIVSHGSKHEEPLETFKKLVMHVRNKNKFDKVMYAFLQFTEPSIEESILDMYNNSIRNVVVMPYFLFKGIHLTRDVKEIIDIAKSQYSDMNITLAEPLGYDEILVDLIIHRAKQSKK